MSDKLPKPANYRRRRCLATANSLHRSVAIRCEWQTEWGNLSNGQTYDAWLEDRLEEAYLALRHVRTDLAMTGVITAKAEDEIESIVTAYMKAWE